MSSLVVCFSGRIGSGKTSVSQRVAETLQGAWTGFGDFVRSEASSRGLDAGRRDVLQDLGAKLISEHGIAWLCTQVIARAHWQPDRPLIIDGVRHVLVLEELRAQLARHLVVLIHLKFEETGQRPSEMDAESRERAENHSTEKDVTRALPARAALVVSADAPFEEVIGTVLEFVRPLTASS